MSIIANALQKQNQHPLEKKSENNNFIWKVLLFAALFVIIVLLSVLIWLITKQNISTSPSAQIANTEVVVMPQKHAQLAPPLAVVTPTSNTVLEQDVIESSTKSVTKPITIVSFETKPLPLINLKDINAVSDGQAKIASGDTSDEDIIDKLQTDSDALTDHEITLASEKISDKLKAHLQEALINNQDDSNNNTDDSDDLNIYKMDINFQQQVPTIRYAFHVYSSNKSERWIRINGEDLKEGEFDSSNKIEVVDIQPNQTIFRVAGKTFYLKSLTDWLPL